jgi:CelD/BcsL family acetyltransferase involved in cellulose biosynthesis
MRIQVCASAEQLAQLRGPWNALLAKAAENTPFLTHEWITAWWRAFGSGSSMYVITAWQEDELVAVAPLAYTKQHMLGATRSVVTFMANEYSNRANFIVGHAPRAALEAILDHLLTSAPPWDLLQMEPVDEDSPVTQAFLKILADRSQAFGIEDSLRSPYLRLPATWAGVKEGLSPSFRKTLDRKLRKSKQLGASLRVRFLTDPDLTEAFDIAAQSWQHAKGTSIASTACLRQFYRELAAARNWSQLTILELDGKPISFEYDLLYERVLYNLKLGYRLQFAALSPGLVLQATVLQHAVEDGVRQYDFMGSDEDYKRHWSQTVRIHRRVVVFNHQLVLRVAHLVRWRVKPFLKAHFPLLVAFKRALRWPGIRAGSTVSPGADQ